MTSEAGEAGQAGSICGRQMTLNDYLIEERIWGNRWSLNAVYDSPCKCRACIHKQLAALPIHNGLDWAFCFDLVPSRRG